MEEGSVRNLERIQEEEDGSRSPRAVSLLLVVIGGAAIVFAGMALGGRRSQTEEKRTDPLGDLVLTKKTAQAVRPADLTPHDVTFPSILSDGDNPTTALAAVTARASSAPPPSAAPVPSDRLSVVPLPAQNVLQASPVVTRPRDTLTKAATDGAQLQTAQAPQTPSGHEGGYQLQVSSFRSQDEANAFADQLRARGHKAYVVEAKVPARGTWYRVRVGPFPTQAAATSYRSSFESKEHVVPFIVPPTK